MEMRHRSTLKSCQDKSPAQCSLCVTEYIILNLMYIRKVTDMTLISTSKHPAKGMWFKHGFGIESSDDVGYLVGLGTAFFNIKCTVTNTHRVHPKNCHHLLVCCFYFRLNSILFAYKQTMPAWQVRTNEVCSGTWSKQGWVFTCS